MELPKISLPYLGGRAMKYGYSNARVKGMKGLLLKQADMDELVRVKSIDAVVELLERTHYKEELTQLSLMYRGSTLVELAAAKHFAKVARKILKTCPKDDKKILDSLLKRWDVLNLKTVIGAKRLGKKFDEIKPYLVPVGSFTERDLQKIFEAEERAVFEEIRRTDFGKEMLAESTALFTAGSWDIFRNAVKNMDSLLQLQALLDAYAYRYVDKHLSSNSKDIQNIRILFKKEIDAKNIAIIERLKVRGMAKEKIKEYLIKGSSFKEVTINSFIESKDFSSALGIAKRRFAGLEIEEGKIKDISGFEIALEKAIALEKVHAFYRSVLSIGSLLGFLLLKEEELNNLRKISKGKEFNLSDEKVRETLVVV